MSTVAKRQPRRTAMVPVTTMEELEIVSEQERAEFIASLEAAEARIAAGQYVEHDPERLVADLLAVRARTLSEKS